jgi:hypothetical protein
MLRESVEAQGQTIARAHGGDLKIDAIGDNADELYIGPVHVLLKPSSHLGSVAEERWAKSDVRRTRTDHVSAPDYSEFTGLKSRHSDIYLRHAIVVREIYTPFFDQHSGSSPNCASA